MAKCVIGAAGGDHPTRGFFDAYDAATGRRAWRFYTVPGNPANPFENDAMRKAAKTWGGDFYKNGGGGSVWDGMAYDPETDLMYVGRETRSPGCRNSAGRRAWTISIPAPFSPWRLPPDKLKWHYQVVPNDNWDYDAVQQLMLADLTINGRPRKVLMQAPKDGFFYVLDRVTGQFISAQPFVQVNWAKGFDENRPAHGQPRGLLRQGSRSRFIPPRAARTTGPPCRSIPPPGLVYIPTTYGNWTFAAGDEVIPAPTGHTGLAPGFLAPKANSMPIIGPEPLEKQPRRSAGLGSGRIRNWSGERPAAAASVAEL